MSLALHVRVYEIFCIWLDCTVSRKKKRSSEPRDINAADQRTYGHLSPAANDSHTYAQLDRTTGDWMCINYQLIINIFTFLYAANNIKCTVV